MVVGPPQTAASDQALWLDIHLDADDPNFDFLTSADLAGMTPDFIASAGFSFKGPRAVVDAYNAPYRRTNRLRIRRATDVRSIELLMMPHWDAADLVQMWRSSQRRSEKTPAV